ADGDAAVPFGLFVLPADQVPFDEERAVHRAELAERPVDQPARQLPFLQPGTDELLDLRPHLGRGDREEGEAMKVAGQADTAGDHHVAFGTGALEPLSGLTEEFLDLHRLSSSSSVLMRSRISAAFSKSSLFTTESRSLFSRISSFSLRIWASTVCGVFPACWVDPWTFSSRRRSSLRKTS